MKTPISSLLIVVGALLLASPAAGQQSDVSGSIPASDISGSFTQSDQGAFQSDAGGQGGDVVSALGKGLRSGSLSPSAVTGQQAIVVPQPLVDLFLSSSGMTEKAHAQYTELLTAQGIPTAEAETLSDAIAGLVKTPVDPEQFRAALHAFNAVVDTAPDSFLANPPQEFIAVRAVLLTLLKGPAS